MESFSQQKHFHWIKSFSLAQPMLSMLFSYVKLSFTSDSIYFGSPFEH